MVDLLFHHVNISMNWIYIQFYNTTISMCWITYLRRSSLFESRQCLAKRNIISVAFFSLSWQYPILFIYPIPFQLITFNSSIQNSKLKFLSFSEMPFVKRQQSDWIIWNSTLPMVNRVTFYKQHFRYTFPKPSINRIDYYLFKTNE